MSLIRVGGFLFRGLLAQGVVLAGVALIGISAAYAGGELVRVQLQDYHQEMKIIQAHAIDVAGVDLSQKQVDLLVSPDEREWLTKRGFKIIYSETSRANGAPDSRYHNPAKIESDLKQYAAAYPTLARVQSIGKSLQGRDIFAIRITKNVQIDDPSKPHVFFNAMHHAREVMTSEVALDIVDQLLTQYGKDPQVTRWLESYVVDVVPMFNVDGNQLVWSQDSMWRKNARGGYGVDINRNYPYAWASCRGSSSSRSAQDFHGDSAASEPETQVMMNFVKSIRPVFSISYHSYSEIVIYPYGCAGQHTETKEIVEPIGKTLASKLKTDDGRTTYTPGTAPELLYSVDGGDIDWLYAVGQVIPYVIEVNSSSQGFQPNYSKWRDSTVQRQREGWKYLLSRMDGTSIFGQIKTQEGVGLENAKVTIRTAQGKLVQTARARAKGFFDVILNPGAYEIKVEAEGYAQSVQSLNLGNERTEIKFGLRSR